MKIRKRFWMVVVVFLFAALILSMAVAAAEGGATIVEFEGTETLVELVYEGDISFPGDPKGDTDDPWTPNFHGRNREWLAIEEVSTSCMTGISHIFSNANINKNGSANYWGTWVIEPEGYDGTWEATWRSKEHGDIYAYGHGTGVFTGMTIKVILDDSGAFTGTIHIPPNAQVSCE